MALGVSLAYGLSNFMAPVLGRRYGSVTVLLISQLLATSVAGLLLLAGGDARPSAAALGYAALAGAGNLIAVTSLYQAATIGPMSLVMPINACGSIVPAIWAEAHGRSLPLHSIVVIGMVLGGAMLAACHRRPVDEATALANSGHAHGPMSSRPTSKARIRSTTCPSSGFA